jgi:hypothetical protein
MAAEAHTAAAVTTNFLAKWHSHSWLCLPSPPTFGPLCSNSLRNSLDSRVLNSSGEAIPRFLFRHTENAGSTGI